MTNKLGSKMDCDVNSCASLRRNRFILTLQNNSNVLLKDAHKGFDVLMKELHSCAEFEEFEPDGNRFRC